MLRRRLPRVLSALLLTLAPTGLASVLPSCVNMHDVVADKDHGAEGRVYPVSEAQAWRIVDAILKIKRSAVETSQVRGRGYVLITMQASALGSGTYLGIWVEPVSPNETRVTFVRKRRVASDNIRALDDHEFHETFGLLVDLMRGGGPSDDAGAVLAASPSIEEQVDAGVSDAAPDAAGPRGATSAPQEASSAVPPAAAPAKSAPPPASTIREVPLPPRRVRY